MFGIKTKSDEFPRHEFADRLDALLAAARKAGVSAATIAELLERRAEAFATQDALSANLGGSPSTVYHDAVTLRPLPR
jgi:hypothetical protein